MRLRYSLGGDRPSQTTHQALSYGRIHGAELGLRLIQGGISRLAPPRLTARLQSLPPILHKTNQRPRPSYSKAPRGLFVLLRVAGIFTGFATSPSPPPRQRPDRYAIRAGRNFNTLLPLPAGSDYSFTLSSNLRSLSFWCLRRPDGFIS